jgi:hypothetical protein
VVAIIQLGVGPVSDDPDAIIDQIEALLVKLRINKGLRQVGTGAPAFPLNTVAPVVSGTPTEGQSLSTTNGTWTNTPTAFHYTWLRDGVPIGAPDANTYTLVTADVGHLISCQVAASNLSGTGTALSNALGPIDPLGLGGAGTLSAPTLGYPSPLAANPTTIAITIPADWQAGDVLKLAYSASLSMASPTILTHTLTDADAAAGSINMNLSAITFSGITYFQALGQHGGVDSANLSGKVTWGDTTAPTITTSATQNNVETQPLAIALTGTDTGGIASWAITGGADQLQFEISGTTLRWIGNGTQTVGSPNDQGSDSVYNVTVTAKDYGGNTSSLSIAVTVVQADTSPTAFSFTDASGVTAGSTNTSNTITIAGLGSGIAAPATVTGGLYSKNGGSFVAAGSFTVVNGDTIALQGTASSTAGASVNITLSVGEASPGSGIVSDTYTITTIGVSNQLDTTINNVSSGGTYTYSNVNKTAKNTNGVANKLALSVTSYSTGKRYFEATLDASSSGCAVGVGDASANTANFTGSDAHSAGYLGAGTEWYNNAIQTASFATYTTGDRIAVALDVDNKKVWFAKFVSGSPVWQGTGANPSTGAGGLSLSNASTGTTFRALIAPNAINNQITLCASAADQLASPPTGFSTWA